MNFDLRRYHAGLYHDMKNTKEDAAAAAAADAAAGFDYVVHPFAGFVPDLAIAFNAGMWVGTDGYCSPRHRMPFDDG